MASVTVSMQSFLFILLSPLVCTSVFANESGADQTSVNSRGASAKSDSAAEFRLKGILISSSGRSILVNDRVAREGDRIAGVDILSITAGEVRVIRGSQEHTLHVGFSGAWDHSSSSPLVTQSDPESRYGPVMRGETLSQIAQRQLSGNVTMNQMMIALFQANPQAFGNNINFLREGATLRIPDEVTLHDHAPETATAEVARQMNAWRTDHEPRIQLAEVIDPTNIVDPMRYGPVARGETLSGIAARISGNGTTINEMMTALFQINPQAFSGNIDFLHEGAVLRIPDEGALHFQESETATAKVVRRLDAWRHDSMQQYQSASPNHFVNAPLDLFSDPGGVLLSMKTHE